MTPDAPARPYWTIREGGVNGSAGAAAVSFCQITLVGDNVANERVPLVPNAIGMALAMYPVEVAVPLQSATPATAAIEAVIVRLYPDFSTTAAEVKSGERNGIGVIGGCEASVVRSVAKLPLAHVLE